MAYAVCVTKVSFKENPFSRANRKQKGPNRKSRCAACYRRREGGGAKFTMQEDLK